ncbi:MAG: YsnF/AvaK domain-containing protein, partial [Actinomycetota bacterium]|nr:YsnF/AvaK domain-containing protein [Actinomycetota bacterium]
GVDPDGELSEREEQRLFEHYGVPYTTEGSTTAQGAPRGGRGESSRGRDDAMTRSEEELRVGTAKQERGRVRLRKYVVTEQVQTTVPVQREEVRIEREPITAENREQAISGAEISEAEHEVVLHEEEPVVEKRTVPKERVRLEKDTVTEERDVSEEVRKERIETEGGERR